MRSGRTTEEGEATYCSSVAGREDRGEMICGCKKRNRRNGNVAEKNAAINLFGVRQTTTQACSLDATRRDEANNFHTTFGREHYFLIIAWLRVDYLPYSVPTNPIIKGSLKSYCAAAVRVGIHVTQTCGRSCGQVAAS